MARAIVNKFSGTCNVCTVRVAAGAGVAVKANGKWKVLCSDHKGETHGATNPWKDLHRTASVAYGDTRYERLRELALVEREFANTDELAEPCECGGTMWYRATILAPQCPDCRAIAVYTVDQATGKVTRKVARR